MSTPETNGRAPATPDDAEETPPESAAIDLGDLDPDLHDDFEDDDDRSRGIEVAFTPRQILGGFALLAGLILLLRRRNRRR
jgi:MYXO-CTERM domain-containing protein